MPPTSSHKLTHQAQRVGQAILDLIFPPRCEVCGQHGYVLCGNCVAAFLPVGTAVCTICGEMMDHSDGLCPRCATTPPLFTHIRSAYRFEGGIRQAIHALKYKRRRTIATPLANGMAQILDIPPSTNRVLCAIPLHPDRQAQRGYNQSALLAQELSRQWQIPELSATALRRIRATESQVDLNYEARQHNVSAAFTAQPELVEGRHIILVDDVCTTGATLNACAEALLSAGAKAVSGVTLARAVFADNQLS
jgi:ComF family protein